LKRTEQEADLLNQNAIITH